MFSLVPAEPSDVAGLADALARLPYLTVHLVDLPDRWWVADPASLTCWVHKGSSSEERWGWEAEAATAILSAQEESAKLPPRARPGRSTRLHSVPRG